MTTPTEQKWTEHYVENELKLAPLRIVMAHNASIAAAQEKSKQAEKEWAKLFDDKMDDNQQLRKQLAAAKAEDTRLANQVVLLHDKLDAAVEALEKIEADETFGIHRSIARGALGRIKNAALTKEEKC